MSLDLLTSSDVRAAVAESDGFCPECSKPLSTTFRADSWPKRPFPTWAAILTVIGVALIVVYGLRALDTNQALGEVQARLVEPSICVADDQSAARCNAIFSRRAARLAGQPSAQLTQRDLERNLVEVAVGEAAILAGIGGLLRAQGSRPAAAGVLEASAEDQATNRPIPVEVPRHVWEAAEPWVLSVHRVLLLALGLAVLARLTQGEVPSWSVLGGAIDRVGEAILGATSLLVG